MSRSLPFHACEPPFGFSANGTSVYPVMAVPLIGGTFNTRPSSATLPFEAWREAQFCWYRSAPSSAVWGIGIQQHRFGRTMSVGIFVVSTKAGTGRPLARSVS